ncbi:phage tail protein [Puniceibacterium sp. IMCC21224]|uniref:phage tail protein n=1 Tax=Puniceibacterium sp. IMCC21224 TaxID=1618204 RepID=UPI0018CD0F54|nr:tail fiber protein [Puniceibacterium sp. IMCC21224]
MKQTATTLGLCVTIGLGLASAATAQDEFIGEVKLFGMNFCPRGWAAAEGQILPISQNTALFSLIGTIYGGDGTSTMALPDLRGRAVVNNGAGPGLFPMQIGQRAGIEFKTLNTSEMPRHNHMVNATNADGTKGGPGTDYLAVGRDDDTGEAITFYSEGPFNRQMDSGMIGMSGGGMPVDMRPPYLAAKWCIALQGAYPPRS